MLSLLKSIFLLFLLSILFLNVKGSNCPHGSEPFGSGEKCLIAVRDAKSYFDVIRYCAQFGGIPVKIENLYENAFLLAMIGEELSESTSYIGIERRANNTWTYSDDTPLTYHNWAKNEPKSTGPCTIMNPSTGKWHSDECEMERPFFCSIQGSASTTSKTPSITTPITTTPSAVCPDGWVYNPNTTFYYYLQNFTFVNNVSLETRNWTEAESLCQQMGAHLVSIHSKDEDQFVYELISSNVLDAGYFCDVAPWVWIGYYGNGTLGTGNWTDGSRDDYFAGYPGSDPFAWMMRNDVPCGSNFWTWSPPYGQYPRFVCKTPSCASLSTNNPITTIKSTSQPDPHCSNGWVYNSNTTFCYYLQNFTLEGSRWKLYNWLAANTSCQRMGANLVSIHSKAEDDFVFELISSNVSDLIYAAPDQIPCYYQRVWIGYNGNGTLGTGYWTDGSKDDYIGAHPSFGGDQYPWLMSNDESCNEKFWDFTNPSYTFARFLCKTRGLSNENQSLLI